MQTIRRLVEIGVPVMGHIGMTPQSVHRFGGFKVQGRTDETAEAIQSAALALVEAGVFSMVLEVIPAALSAQITAAVPVRLSVSELDYRATDRCRCCTTLSA